MPLPRQLQSKGTFDANALMPAEILAPVLAEFALRKASCQQHHYHSTRHQPRCLPQQWLNRPQSHRAARLRHHSLSQIKRSSSIHHSHPNNPEAIPHQRRLHAQVHPLLTPAAITLHQPQHHPLLLRQSADSTASVEPGVDQTERRATAEQHPP